MLKPVSLTNEGSDDQATSSPWVEQGETHCVASFRTPKWGKDIMFRVSAHLVTLMGFSRLLFSIRFQLIPVQQGM